jgi:hypothetical protein
VDVLAGVFFHVNPKDANAPRTAFAFDVKRATRGQGFFVLTDLIALGKVRVEVILTGKYAGFVNFAAERERGAHSQPHSLTVEHRQRTGQPQADGANIAIRELTKTSRTAAE